MCEDITFAIRPPAVQLGQDGFRDAKWNRRDVLERVIERRYCQLVVPRERPRVDVKPECPRVDDDDVRDVGTRIVNRERGWKDLVRQEAQHRPVRRERISRQRIVLRRRAEFESEIKSLC